jgi:hypothetical protein
MKPVSMEIIVEKVMTTGRCMAGVTQALQKIRFSDNYFCSAWWHTNYPIRQDHNGCQCYHEQNMSILSSACDGKGCPRTEFLK